MPPILFTPASARSALVRVRPVAVRIRALFRALEERHPGTVASDQPVDARYFALLTRYAARVAELTRHGVRLGDPRSGAVEFPARRSGRAVHLCWRVGEPSLSHWSESGSSGRAGLQALDGDEGRWEDGTSC